MKKIIRNQNDTDQRRILYEFLFETFSGIYVIAIVLTCWTNPFWASLFLSVGLGVQFLFWKEKADVAMMVAAGILGTPSEMLCVKFGIWSYHAPGLFLGVPVWIPLVWAYLFCFFRRLSITIDSAIQIKWAVHNANTIKVIFWILNGLILMYYITTSIIINQKIAVIYSFFMVPAMIFWRKQRDILLFIIGAIFGTLGEYLCMKLGFWQYHYPYLRSIGLPISLPLAWGLSSIIIGNIAIKWE